MKHSFRTLLQTALVGGMLLAATMTQAQYYPVTPYLQTSDSPFIGIAPGSFFLEDFEDGLLNTLGVSASGGVIFPPDVYRDSVDGDDGSVDGSGQQGHALYPGDHALTFTFDAGVLGGLPTHAGIVWTDVADSDTPYGTGNVYFEAFDMNGTSLGVVGPVLLGDGDGMGTTAEDRFFGVEYVGGIWRLTISMPGSLDWEVDHLQYGRAVPEPGTLALFLGAGMVSLGSLLQQRRTRYQNNTNILPS